MWKWLAFMIAGSIALHWWNRDVLNTDAIAYLRIANYFSAGEFDLAVNGYWGPLLSWLMVPFLKFGIPPLIAARLAMLVSTVIFAFGANRIMSLFGLSRRSRVLGLVMVCLAAAVWGSQNITPDLLLAGLALVALSFTMPAFKEQDSRAAGFAGLAWGAAYLAKAIALPWAVLIIGSYSLIQWRRRKAFLFSAAMIGAGIAIVALPWITNISIKSGHLTFSTSGRIAHALAGPAGEVRYHPTFVTLHHPKPGRLTSWENPVELPYHYWS